LFATTGNQPAGIYFLSHKKHFKIFEFNKFAYLCLPKKTGEYCVCFSSLYSGSYRDTGKRIIARVAQMVEQLICNQLVGGSIPFSGSTGSNAVFGRVQACDTVRNVFQITIRASSQVANDNRL
jgi:hypothetical protein